MIHSIDNHISNSPSKMVFSCCLNLTSVTALLIVSGIWSQSFTPLSSGLFRRPSMFFPMFKFNFFRISKLNFWPIIFKVYAKLTQSVHNY